MRTLHVAGAADQPCRHQECCARRAAEHGTPLTLVPHVNAKDCTPRRWIRSMPSTKNVIAAGIEWDALRTCIDPNVIALLAAPSSPNT
ncbi:hypothetical protein E2562_036935 [Oryza meyeriana var. granulata]|uniref:Uncharacterized protein n=1 Tax=Oryza meyeriana var. granulata TaxID=110450 RepID=A0A6G1FGL9_9ORYZ|nr:hypothetical protein E2562_036935 [Oryza meyeriana var. granulata]